jgi:hypothetical protein
MPANVGPEPRCAEGLSTTRDFQVELTSYSGIRWIDYGIGKRALTPSLRSEATARQAALSHPLRQARSAAGRMGEGEASLGLVSILRPSQYGSES